MAVTDLPTIIKYTDLVESDKFKLYCRAVEDGTPCTVDSYDKCVVGQYVQAGCDHILGSNVKLDKQDHLI